jgi:hypothetical protein
MPSGRKSLAPSASSLAQNLSKSIGGFAIVSGITLSRILLMAPVLPVEDEFVCSQLVREIEAFRKTADPLIGATSVRTGLVRVVDEQLGGHKERRGWPGQARP